MATQIIARLRAVVQGKARRWWHLPGAGARNQYRAMACPVPPPGERSHLSSEIFDEANGLWGPDNQYLMLMEEMAKLQEFVCRLRRDESSPELLGELCERLADVELMLGQIKQMWKCQVAVEAARRAKLRRLEVMLWPEKERGRGT